MYKVVVCSCGKSLRAYEGMPEIRCPVCRKSIHLENGPLAIKSPRNDQGRSSGSAPQSSFDDQDDDLTNNRAEATVFGFDPPPPRVQKTPLNYKVVEVSSENTPPNPKPKPKRVEPDRSDETFQEALWGPKGELEEEWPNIRRKRRRGEWGLERSWYECLAYAIRGLPLIGSLGFALTIATFGLLQVLRDDAAGGWFFYLVGSCAATYACGFLSCVLNSGARGNTLRLQWPKANLKLLLESLLAGLFSFLAGPIVPAAFGLYFWVNSGEMTVLDSLILLELAVATIGYWLLVFVSVSLSDHWSAMLPTGVMERVRFIGVGRTILALAIALAIFFFHGWLAVIGVENHHSAASFMLLLICWSSVLFWMVFLMRWLGVNMYRRARLDVPR